jgi:hypothetical protein
MGKRIVISENEKIKIRKLYGLSEGLDFEQIMLGIGSVIFLRKFFQGLRSDPKFKALFVRDEDVEQNIRQLDKMMETYLNGLDETYSDLEEYDPVEMRDIYENDIKPLLREKKLVDMEDIVNYLSYKLNYLNNIKVDKFFSKD